MENFFKAGILKITFLEIQLGKTFEFPKIKICGTMPKADDKDAESLILRLYGLLYEMCSYKDRDFIFE